MDARTMDRYYRALVDARDASWPSVLHSVDDQRGNNVITHDSLKFAAELVRDLLDGKLVRAEAAGA